MDTPEQRRDAAISAAIEAGASVLSVAPMATTADPHVVTAYSITFGASEPGVFDALAEVRAETEIDLTGLVFWTPVEVDDAPLSDI